MMMGIMRWVDVYWKAQVRLTGFEGSHARLSILGCNADLGDTGVVEDAVV